MSSLPVLNTDRIISLPSLQQHALNLTILTKPQRRFHNPIGQSHGDMRCLLESCCCAQVPVCSGSQQGEHWAAGSMWQRAMQVPRHSEELSVLSSLLKTGMAQLALCSCLCSSLKSVFKSAVWFWVKIGLCMYACRPFLDQHIGILSIDLRFFWSVLTDPTLAQVAYQNQLHSIIYFRSSWSGQQVPYTCIIIMLKCTHWPYANAN